RRAREVRLPARRTLLWSAAPRRTRIRPGPPRDAHLRRGPDPRRDSLPQDAARTGPDGRRAQSREREAAARPAHPAEKPGSVTALIAHGGAGSWRPGTEEEAVE